MRTSLSLCIATQRTSAYWSWNNFRFWTVKKCLLFHRLTRCVLQTKSVLLSFINKILLEQSHAYWFIYCLQVNPCCKIQKCIAEVETMWPMKAKIFTVQLFPEKSAAPCSIKLSHWSWDVYMLRYGSFLNNKYTILPINLDYKLKNRISAFLQFQ